MSTLTDTPSPEPANEPQYRPQEHVVIDNAVEPVSDSAPLATVSGTYHVVSDGMYIPEKSPLVPGWLENLLKGIVTEQTRNVVESVESLNHTVDSLLSAVEEMKAVYDTHAKLNERISAQLHVFLSPIQNRLKVHGEALDSILSNRYTTDELVSVVIEPLTDRLGTLEQAASILPDTVTRSIMSSEYLPQIMGAVSDSYNNIITKLEGYPTNGMLQGTVQTLQGHIDRLDLSMNNHLTHAPTKDYVGRQIDVKLNPVIGRVAMLESATEILPNLVTYNALQLGFTQPMQNRIDALQASVTGATAGWVSLSTFNTTVGSINNNLAAMSTTLGTHISTAPTQSSVAGQITEHLEQHVDSWTRYQHTANTRIANVEQGLANIGVGTTAIFEGRLSVKSEGYQPKFYQPDRMDITSEYIHVYANRKLVGEIGNLNAGYLSDLEFDKPIE